MSDTAHTKQFRTYTSESVTEGHPDKVADRISDALLDQYLASDPQARVAIETLVKGQDVILAGEVTTHHSNSFIVDDLVRRTIKGLGYNDPQRMFSAENIRITNLITPQSREITHKVNTADGTTGAGDQGVMFGYATNETPEGLPLPIVLAHRLTRMLSDDRKSGHHSWILPDGKAQVSVAYDGDRPIQVETVVVSTQHTEITPLEHIRDYIQNELVPRALDEWFHDNITIHANPGGSFILGGPEADAGLTGRKIIVDTYGGLARHGGGAFSGKDASKVDRSGAYAARQAALTLIRLGLAQRAEVQLAYAIGQSEPVSVAVETFGTGSEEECARLLHTFDFSPDAIFDRLHLGEPRFGTTTNYGHFGRPEHPWEQPLTSVTAQEVQS